MQGTKFGVGAFSVCLATAVALTSAHSAECTILKRDPLTLRDRSLFYQPPNSSEWREIDDAVAGFVRQTLTFVYVIQEKYDPKRAGVAIVKSGRTRQLDEPAVDPGRTIDLVHNTADADPDVCKPVPGGIEKRTLASAYDAYHDRGQRVTQVAELNSFHYKYAARRQCIKTNSTNEDPGSRRSNLKQFSFNPDVVRGETPVAALSYLEPRSAYAGGSDGLLEQRVEMQAYRVRRGFPSCIVFNLKLPVRAGFLRINDLEALKESGVDLIRHDEQNWALSR